MGFVGNNNVFLVYRNLAKGIAFIQQSTNGGLTYGPAFPRVEFDEKGDRKNAEITIFTLKDGKVVPVGVVKAGKASSFEDFMKTMQASAATANPAPAAAPAPAMAPAEAPKK